LWFNDGTWWANMWDTSSSDFHIFKWDASTKVWARTSTKVDTRANTHADVLWDGTKLYISSHRSLNDGLPAQVGFPSQLFRYSYDTSTDTYTLDSGYPSTVNDVRSETLTIDKDTAGVLWATWQQGNAIYVNHSAPNDQRTWSKPVRLPTAPDVSVDDTSALIAYRKDGVGYVGVMWSTQDGAAPDGMYFSVHRDGDPDTAWAGPITAYQAPRGGDDHINLKWLDASTNRVYAAVKTSYTSGSDPLLQLLVFDASTGQFQPPHTIAKVSECGNRVILLIDEAKGLLRTFATYPGPDGVCSTSGGAIYEKSTPLSSISFPADRGQPVILDADSQVVHNATSTKQNIKPGMGVVVLAANAQTSRYWTFHEPPGSTPADTTAPDTTITSAAPSSTTTSPSFTFTSDEANSTFECKLDAHAYTACTSPTAYPGLTDGPHTFSVRAKDAAGNTDGTPASQTWTIQTTTPPPTGGTTSLTAVEDTWVGSDATTATHGTDTLLYSVGGTTTKITYLKFDLTGITGTVNDATLTVTTGSGAYSGSPSAQDIFAVADSTWTEGAMTYANKPALGATKLGSIPGGSTPNTAYTVTLPAQLVQEAAGKQLTVAIKGAAADTFYINSSEASAAPPRLTVTIG
jgi:hypothetical protein